MAKKAVSVDEAIRVVKDSLDEMDMDVFPILLEQFFPCKNVSYNVDTDEIEYDLDELNADIFSQRSHDLPDSR